MSELPLSPLDRVAAFQPLWSDLHRRNQRTAGLDARLAGEYRTANQRMNELLEDLFAKNVILLAAHEPYVKPVENFGLGKATLYEDIPIKHTDGYFGPADYEGA